MRVVVGVGAFLDLPIIKALAPFPGNEGGTAAVSVDVPFADARGVVAGVLEHFRQGDRICGERHVVEEDAVGEGALAP
jgi:hypothetical protein